MRALLVPAVAMMNRLTFSRKFLIVGLIAAIATAIPLTLFVTHMRDLVGAAQNELQGVELIQPVNKLVQSLQQHRGLSAGLLSGTKELADKRAAKQAEVETAFKTVNGALPSGLRAGETWQGIQSSWQGIAAKGLSLTAQENTIAHTELIDRMLAFLIVIADEYSLTLDPALDSFYLMDSAIRKQPVVLERLGRLRALGTGALSRQSTDEATRIAMSVQLSDLASAQRQLAHDLDKIAMASPANVGPLRDHYRQIAESSDRLIQVINGNILTGKASITPGAYFDMATDVIDSGYRLFFDYLVPALRTSIQSRLNADRSKMVIAEVISFGALFITAYLTLAMSAGIGDAVRSLHNASTQLADGDLTARASISSKDELGDIGRAFDSVAGSIQRLIAQVQHGASDVSAATRRLSEASASIRSATAEQSDAASGMAAAVEQMTVGVDEIGRNSEEAHRLSQEAGLLSARGGEIVNTVVQEIEALSQSVHGAAERIGELGRDSDRISTVVNVIRDIADQTNLLALNAAIEAARAGESGRGFAVVADEVRKLAERTAQSTGDITDMITTIQKGAQDAVATMEGGVLQVNQGVQMAREAGEAMSQIRRGADEVVHVINEITGALREQTAAAQEIAKNVERIAQMSERNSDAVGSNADTVGQLDSLATALQTEVSRFRA
jgi:methyl-accepting chemotaxis protein